MPGGVSRKPRVYKSGHADPQDIDAWDQVADPDRPEFPASQLGVAVLDDQPKAWIAKEMMLLLILWTVHPHLADSRHGFTR